MSRAKKGVASEGKGTTLQDDIGSDSRLELLTNIVSIMEEKFLIFEKRLDAIKECLKRLEQPRFAAMPVFKRSSVSEPHPSPKLEERISPESTQQQYQWSSSSQPLMHQQQPISAANRILQAQTHE